MEQQKHRCAKKRAKNRISHDRGLKHSHRSRRRHQGGQKCKRRLEAKSQANLVSVSRKYGLTKDLQTKQQE
jgi:hypothetical protein